MNGKYTSQFEQDLDTFVKKERPGCTVMQVDCTICGFFGFIVIEVEDSPTLCPNCGQDHGC